MRSLYDESNIGCHVIKVQSYIFESLYIVKPNEIHMVLGT